MKRRFRIVFVLAPLVIAFDILPCAIRAENGGRPLLSDAPAAIGENAPLCVRDFVEKNPALKGDLDIVSRSTLRIDCNAPASGSYSGTAVYVDTPSKRVVITAEHTFSRYNFDSKLHAYKLRDVVPTSSCSLTTFDNQVLQFDSSISGMMGHPVDNVSLDGTTDWAVLALEKIPNVTPIALSRVASVAGNQTLLRMGATGYGIGGAGRCPTATVCRARKAIVLTGRAAFYLTDCSASPGASGGPIAATRQGERPSLVAIYTGDNIQLPSGSPFDEKKMYATAIGVSGPFLRSIREVDALARRATPAR